MPKTLIIPDIHLRHKQVDVILSWEQNVDKTIFLGDHFDQFSDSVIQNMEAAEWVKSKVNDPKNVFLFGNHDISYCFRNNAYACCSGFTKAKAKAINSILKAADWKKFNTFHIDQGVVFSHAGFDNWFLSTFEYTGTSLADFQEWAQTNGDDFKKAAKKNVPHPFMCIGPERGGLDITGGPFWVDFRSLVPAKGLKQIVGHTICRTPQFRFLNNDKIPFLEDCSMASSKAIIKGLESNRWALGLDTNNRHYATLTDGVLEVKSVNWTRNLGEYTFEVSQGETICKVKIN
jgi:hypothetical protein